MPWRCPACHLPIRHNDLEERPRLDARYRCHICRLELVVDPRTNKLVVAPTPNDDSDDRRNQP
jgi:hypothetical protein